MSTIYDGKFEQPLAVRSVRIRYPYPDFKSLVVYEQDYVVRTNSYVTEGYDVRHHIYSDAVLAEEVNFQSIGGGLTQFTRIFVVVPTEMHSEPLVTGYTYPGMSISYRFRDIVRYRKTVRQPFTRRVAGRIIHTYHKVGVGASASISVREGQRVMYNGFMAQVGSIDEESGNVTISYYDRNGRQTAEVTPFFLESVSDGENLASFKGLPVSQPFTIKKTATWYYEESGTVRSYPLPQEVMQMDSNDWSALPTETITTTTDMLSQYTSPTLQEYRDLTAIQIDETQITHVLGNIYRCTNLYVPAL